MNNWIVNFLSRADVEIISGALGNCRVSPPRDNLQSSSCHHYSLSLVSQKFSIRSWRKYDTTDDMTDLDDTTQSYTNTYKEKIFFTKFERIVLTLVFAEILSRYNKI